MHSAEDLSQESLSSYPLFLGKIPDVIISKIFFYLSSPQEVALVSLVSKRAKKVVEEANIYWLPLLIEIGIEKKFILHAEENNGVNYKKWYSACKTLILHAPSITWLPKGITRRPLESAVLFEGRKYSINSLPPAYQLLMSGSLSILKSELVKEYMQRVEIYMENDIAESPGFNKYGNTLHFAAWSGFHKLLIKMLKSKHGQLLLRQDTYTMTVWFCALKSGAAKNHKERFAILSLLVKTEPDLKELLAYFWESTGTNLLHEAAREGWIDVLQVFYNFSPLNGIWLIRSDCGATALHYAHLASLPQPVIDYLLSLKVGLNKRLLDNQGRKPSDWIVEEEKKEEVEFRGGNFNWGPPHNDAQSLPADSETDTELETYSDTNPPGYTKITLHQPIREEEKRNMSLEIQQNNLAFELIIDQARMGSELEALKEKTYQERIKKTAASLVGGAIMTGGISYVVTGTVLLSVCCAGAIGVLLIALMLHSVRHCRISFFKSPAAYQEEREIRERFQHLHSYR